MKVPLMFMIATILVIMLAAFTVKGTTNEKVERPVPVGQWTEKARTWAARSVIGEAGWGTSERPHEVQNEWVSIMQVYAVRYRQIRLTGRNWSLTKIIRRYSAAVKRRSTHERPWILGITRECRRPKHWPKELRWKAVHKPICERAFLTLDRWVNGELETLTPEANHYGGDMDAWYAEKVRKWKRVPTPSYYGNKFYNSKKLTGKPIRRLMFGNLELVRPEV